MRMSVISFRYKSAEGISWHFTEAEGKPHNCENKKASNTKIFTHYSETNQPRNQMYTVYTKSLAPSQARKGHRGVVGISHSCREMDRGGPPTHKINGKISNWCRLTPAAFCYQFAQFVPNLII